MNFTGLVIVTPAEKTYAKGGELSVADSNGMLPVILNIVAGKSPNRNVLSGTVASKAGFQPGKTYLAQVTETAPDEKYGRQFNWLVLKELAALEIVDAQIKLGAAHMFEVEVVNAEAETKTITVGAEE